MSPMRLTVVIACFVTLLLGGSRVRAETCWNKGQHRFLTKEGNLVPPEKSLGQSLDQAGREGLAAKLANAKLAKEIGEAYDGPVLQGIGQGKQAMLWGGATLYLGVLSEAGGKLKLDRKIRLAETNGEPPSAGAMAFFDVDGDSHPELVVTYGYCLAFAPGSGCSSESQLAIFTLPDLKQEASIVMGESGALSNRGDCDSEVVLSDPRCTGHPDLFLALTCREHGVSLDPPAVKSWEVYRYQKDRDAFVEHKSDAPKIKDDRPWLLLLESIPYYRGDGEKAAHKLKDKLVSAGASDAAVHASDAFDKLVGGYWVVVAGRFKTRAEAVAASARLKKQKLNVYPKLGF
jgi:hypothetical protein